MSIIIDGQSLRNHINFLRRQTSLLNKKIENLSPASSVGSSGIMPGPSNQGANISIANLPVKDEDNMASNSDVHLVTQQSVKQFALPLAGGVMTGSLTVGVDDTGHDVKFFGATSGAYLLWDESADKLLTAGGTTIDIVKDKLLIGGTAVTTTAAELNVLDGYTGSVTELNYLDTLHATGVTDTEFNYLDGVTSNIQTQINDLQPKPAEGAFEDGDKTKLDGIAANANNYVLPAAGSGTLGGIELGYTDNGKNYALEVDGDGEAYVNVPWTDNDTIYTLPLATDTVRGGVELFSNTDQTVAANSVTTTAGRTYGVQLNSDDQMVVNVPWTDTNTVYTHPTHDGDDIDIDTTALTGATVISDLDFNITTDTLGHVTDANGTVTTRDLTLNDLGYTGAADANKYVLPIATASALGGIKVGSNLTIDAASGVLNVGAIALTTVQAAANETAHLNLTAQEGDIVVRSDENKSYVHNGGTAGTMADYTLLLTPTDAVLSVTTTDGTYINLTPNTATTGAINVTADLSAADGTADTTTRFLSKDNTWDVPAYTTNTFRTIKVDTTNNGTANETIGATEELKLIGGTAISLAENAGVVTINGVAETYTAHDNISAASSVDNSGRTYIQDITLDSNGHVTGITSATETVTDTNTFRTVKVDTNGDGSANNTLEATEDLMLKKGSNITLAEAGGVVTISSTATGTLSGSGNIGQLALWTDTNQLGGGEAKLSFNGNDATFAAKVQLGAASSGTLNENTGVKLAIIGDGGNNNDGLIITRDNGSQNQLDQFINIYNDGTATFVTSGGTSTHGTFDFKSTNDKGDTSVSRLSIDASGQVGVGTMPAQTLEIHNSTTTDYTDFGLKGTGHKYVIGVGNDSVANVNDKLYFYDNDNTAFRIVLDTTGKISIGGYHTATSQVHIKNTSGDNRGLIVENTVAASYAELAIKSDTREFRLGTGGSGVNANATNVFYVYDATTGGTAGHRFEISSAGDVQARRERSNTEGEVALSIQPSDSTIHYGFRIDQTANTLNLDRVDVAGNLMSIDASGNSTFVGDVNVRNAGTRFISLNYEDSVNSIISHSGTNFGLESLNVRGDNIYFYTDYDTGTPKGNLTLTLDSSNNATFAGNVTVDGGQVLTPGGVNLALNPNTGVVTVGGVIQASGTGNNTFAGVLVLPDGSVSAPSIGNTGDTNTGMYWPGDHQLGFAVNGSRKFYMSETQGYFQNLSSGISISAGGIDVTGNSTFTGNIRITEDIGRDDHNRIMFSTDDSIIYRVADSHRFRMDSDNFSPYVDSSYDLGTSSKYFRAAYIDTINTTGDLTVGGDLTVDDTVKIQLALSTLGTVQNFTKGGSTGPSGQAHIQYRNFRDYPSSDDNSKVLDIAATSGKWGSTAHAASYIRFSTAAADTDTTEALLLGPDNAATFAGTITAGSHIATGGEFQLNSGAQIDWANGDARIVEGDTNNYSLSFQTFDGSNCSTALRLDGDNTATFTGNIRTGGTAITANTNFDNLVIEGTSHTGISIISGSTGTDSDGGIYFGDQAANNLGQIKYLHASNSMTFATNDGSASLTLDSGLNATFAGNVTISGGDSGGDAAVGAPVFRINNTTESADWDVGDVVGSIEYYSSDASGNAPYVTSFIKSINTTGNGTLPDGALSFGTAVYNTSGGAAERMRIDHQGDLTVIASYGGGTDPFRVGHGTYDSFTSTFTIDDNGHVGINVDPSSALLQVKGTGDAIRVESTNAGSGGAQMDLLHFTASPADEDIHGVINMGGYYTGTTSVYGSQIKSIWTDVANRHSRLEFYTCDTSVAKVLTLDHAKGATFTGYVVTDGQVGVDTYSPYTGTMLHASGASTSPDTSATNPTDTTAFFTNSDIAYGTLFATHGTGIGEIMQRRTNAATYYDLHLQPHGGEDAGLGIGGSVEAGFKFQVNGNSKFSGANTVADFTSSSTYSDIIFRNSAGVGGFVNFNSTTSFNVYVGGGSGSDHKLSLTNAGLLTVTGDVVAYGSPSDISLKENIKPIDNALDKVSKLKGVTFDWKKSDSILKIKEDIGFIAQDVKEVLPDLVRTNDDGKLSLRDKGIIPVLVEAIKELEARVKELENK